LQPIFTIILDVRGVTEFIIILNFEHDVRFRHIYYMDVIAVTMLIIFLCVPLCTIVEGVTDVTIFTTILGVTGNGLLSEKTGCSIMNIRYLHFQVKFYERIS
jgi:hypothetical protein